MRPATAIEMGASQAPWCLSWIRGHRSLGPTKSGRVRAVAYEAGRAAQATERFWAAQELGSYTCTSRSGDGLVFAGEGWTVDWHERAVAVGGGTVSFPDIDVQQDNGAQAVRTQPPLDYRGHTVQYRTVAAVDPSDAVLRHEHVHLLHLDIQGGEEPMLASGGFQSLRDRVSVIMLGTHSRSAEALAFEHLPRAGFVLLAEEACRHTVIDGEPRLTQDGEQLWISTEALKTLAGLGLLVNLGLLSLKPGKVQDDLGAKEPGPARSDFPPHPAMKAVRDLCRASKRALRSRR